MARFGTDPHNDPQTSHWHLDKRVNLAIIITVALAMLTGIANSVSLAWYAAAFATKTETRLDNAERRLALYEELSRKLAETQASMQTTMAVNAETLRQISVINAKLEQKLDQLVRPPGGR